MKKIIIIVLFFIFSTKSLSFCSENENDQIVSIYKKESINNDLLNKLEDIKKYTINGLKKAKINNKKICLKITDDENKRPPIDLVMLPKIPIIDSDDYLIIIQKRAIAELDKIELEHAGFYIASIIRVQVVVEKGGKNGLIANIYLNNDSDKEKIYSASTYDLVGKKRYDEFIDFHIKKNGISFWLKEYYIYDVIIENCFR